MPTNILPIKDFYAYKSELNGIVFFRLAIDPSLVEVKQALPNKKVAKILSYYKLKT